MKTTNPNPGDVVAFNYTGGSTVVPIGIYIGGKVPDGRAAMIDSPQTGVRLGLHGFDFGLLGYHHYTGATAADSIVTRPTITNINVSDTDAAMGQEFTIAASAHSIAGGRTAGVPLKMHPTHFLDDVQGSTSGGDGPLRLGPRGQPRKPSNGRLEQLRGSARGFPETLRATSPDGRRPAVRIPNLTTSSRVVLTRSSPY